MVCVRRRRERQTRREKSRGQTCMPLGIFGAESELPLSVTSMPDDDWDEHASWAALLDEYRPRPRLCRR